MTEGIAEVRNALVEAITARKLIEKKLKKAQEELDTEKRRLTEKAALSQMVGAEEKIKSHIHQLELLIAELNADQMAQEDLETQLKATLFKLEHAVPSARIPNIGDPDQADEAMDRFENVILQKEAYAELTTADRKKDVEFEKLAKETSVDDELAALKEQLRQNKNDSDYDDIKIIVTDDDSD
ncbi:MAG: hypothetical protein K2Z81_10360 [Cyanobacteria bacterium]|nr:hypothetical protein [Cyanobacteriota bacterium]